MAAAEFSYDHNWIRYRVSGFYASGDSNVRDGRARGFDSILDLPSFAGGLSASGIANKSASPAWSLTPPAACPFASFEQRRGPGQFRQSRNFSRQMRAPILTSASQLRAFANFNYLRFDRTEPLEFILLQGRIRHSIGEDYGIGETADGYGRAEEWPT